MKGKPYVTYIEKMYLKKCKKSGDGADIEADWLSKKLLYREMTKTTVYEFMNYSLHDESHAINILESIEMLLGRDRIKKLSRSDLWLLLNAAYAHDIGMVSEYKDLELLWKDSQFQEYIKKAKESLDKDEARAANLYAVLDGLLKGYGGDHEDTGEEWFKYFDTWPLEMRKDITMLMANYIRGRHGELSKQFFAIPEKTNNYIICDRLYHLIGRVSACHAEDQENVEALPCRCKGFGTDWVHPRFIAMLLRLGDLLDLDNNRFDIFSMKHFGPLPEISVLNYKKHKSITHFHIEPKVIEVTAHSDEFEVCKLNHIWFQYLKRDIVYLITHWSQMAPKKLKGCLLGLPELNVYHGKYQFEENSSQGFILEKGKLLKLFTGNNLYFSELDFIREYIQNAFDASKLQLFYEIEEPEEQMHNGCISTKRNLYLQSEEMTLDQLKPFDLTKMAFEAFPIIIELEPDVDGKSFLLRISDKGIGIDSEGLKAIINVGLGWKRRKHHSQAILRMRKWLQPTGGFGIGLQSAFLCTDEVRIYTKSAFEEGYRITLSKYSNEKNVFVEIDNSNIYQGTTAEFKIEFNAFDTEKIVGMYLTKNSLEGDVFSIKGKMEKIRDIIEEYIRATFPTSLFPIILQTNLGNEYGSVEKKQIISSIVYDCQANSYEIPKYRNCQNQEDGCMKVVYQALAEFVGDPKRFWVHLKDMRMRVWDDKAQVFYCFDMPKSGGKKVETRANYKNVLVKDNTMTTVLEDSKHPEFFDISYDVMGVSANECLVVSRNAFKSRKSIFVDELAVVYIQLLRSMLLKNGSLSQGVPVRVLIYILLVSEYRDGEIDLNNDLIEKYGELLEQEVLNVWGVEEKNSEIVIKKQILTAEKLFKGSGNFTVMAQVAETEDVLEAPLYECRLNAMDGGTIWAENKDWTKDDVKIGEANKIKILCDRKFYAILSHYRKMDHAVLFDFDKLHINGNMSIKAYFWGKTEHNNTDLIEVVSENNKARELEGDSENEFILERRYRPVNMAHDQELEPLIVHQVPFRANKSKDVYIITPYTKEIGMYYDKMRGMQCERKIKDIIKRIEQDNSFRELCQWVYDHQKDKGKYSMNQIQEAYRWLVYRDLKKMREESSIEYGE